MDKCSRRHITMEFVGKHDFHSILHIRIISSYCKHFYDFVKDFENAVLALHAFVSIQTIVYGVLENLKPFLK